VFPACCFPIHAQATRDTATEKPCFLCGLCLDVKCVTINEESSVEYSEVVSE
jgi:hypothetical protein